MNRKRFLSMNIVILILITSQSSSSNIKTFDLNQKDSFSIKDKTGGKDYFQVFISKKYKGYDLVVQLFSKQTGGDPDLKVYLDMEDEPTSKDSYFCQSNNYRSDICIIQEQNIIEEIFILIEVSCATSCKYFLRNTYKKKTQYSLQDSGNIFSLFSKYDALGQINIKIPSQDWYVIVNVEMVPQTYEVIDVQLIEMFGNIQSKPFKNKKDAQLRAQRDLNNNFEMVIELKDIFKLCQFSVFLSAKFIGHIFMKIEFYQSVRSIGLSQSIFESFKSGQTKRFEINLNEQIQYFFKKDIIESKEIIDFYLTVLNFKKNVRIEVYYGDKPFDFKQKSWKFDLSKIKMYDLILQKDLFKQKQKEVNNMIFIDVHAESDTPVYFIVKNTHENSQVLTGMFDEEFIGYVDQNKIQNLFLDVKINLKSEIELIFTRLEGNPDIFIRGLKSIKDNNQINQEEINEYYKDQSNINSFLCFSTNNLRVDTIFIKLNPTNCGIPFIDDEDQDGEIEIYHEVICVYNISIIGKEQKNNKYQMEFKQSSPYYVQPITQFEKLVFIYENEQYLVFQPNEQIKDIEQISFMVQVKGAGEISADRKLSNLLLKPEKSAQSGSSSSLITYFSYEFLEQEPSSLSFFIKVKVFTGSEVTLLVQIDKKKRHEIFFSDEFISPKIKFLLQANTVKYVDFKLKQRQDVTFLAKSNGKFYMILRQSSSVSKKYYFLNADDNQESSDFIKRIQFDPILIQCFLKICYLEITNLENYFVEVELVQILNNVRTLILNETIEDIIYEREVFCYSWILYKEQIYEQAYIIISSQNSQDDQNIILKLQIDEITIEQFVFSEQILIKFVPYDYSEFFINQIEDIKIQIVIQVEKTQPISISLNQPSSVTTLLDYEDTISQIPLNGEIRKFNFLGFKQNEVILNIQSEISLIILGKVYKLDFFDDNNLFPHPKSSSEEKLSFSIKANKKHQIRIQPYTFNGEFCQKECLIAISVILGEVEIKDINLIGNTFKIGISGSSIKHLKDGEAEQGYVQGNRLKIYSFTGNPYQNMLITLTPLDKGNPNLYLNEGSQLPTQNEYSMCSDDVGGDFIQIDSSTFQKNDQDEVDLNTNYLVTVFSEQFSVFSIRLQRGQEKIKKIKLNEVQEINFDTNGTRYFVFDKKESGTLAVILNIAKGKVGDMLVFLKEFQNKDYQDILRNLISEKDSDQTVQYSINNKILVYKQSKCDSCLYIIGVKVKAAISFSISAHIEEEISFLQNHSKFSLILLENIVSKLIFFSNDDFNLIVLSLSNQCIDVNVYATEIQFERSKILSKLCSEKESVRGLFSDVIRYPITNEKQNQENKAKSPLIFQIELLPAKDEEVFVYGLIGRFLKLIELLERIEIQVSFMSQAVEFLYFSSSEQRQSVQVNVALLSKEPESLKDSIIISMEEADTQKSVIHSIIASSPSASSINFKTEKNQPYLLKVKYKGLKTLNLSLILKEQSINNIKVLKESLKSTHNFGDFSAYVIHENPPQKLFIQNFDCYQKQQSISFYKTTDDLFALKNSQGMDTKTISEYHRITTISLEEENNKLYILMANKEPDTLTSLLTLTGLDPSQLLIYDYLERGDKGNISYYKDQESIKFYGLQCLEQNCSIFSSLGIKMIEYQLHIGKNILQITKVANCGLAEDQGINADNKLTIKGEEFKSNQPIIFNFKKEQISSEEIFVSISAEIKIVLSNEGFENEPQYFKYIYKTLQINKHHQAQQEQESSNFNSPLKEVGLSLIGGGTVILLYKFNKRRREYTQFRTHSYELQSNS